MLRKVFRPTPSKGNMRFAVSPRNALTAFLQKLRPLSVGAPLVRIGPDGDGGYLLPDDFQNIAACFSPGVGDSIGFEEELARRFAMPSFMADDSVAPPTSDCSRLWHFEQKRLGTRNDATHMRLEDWVRTHSDSGDLILQMDIEGSEYAVLSNTPHEILRRFRIMVVEFHGLDVMLAAEGLRHVAHVFEKVLDSFHVAHIHPNNRGLVNSCHGIDIPRVMEFTFYRKDRAKPDGKRLHFPHKLDHKNAPDQPEITLPACWQ